jgi:ribose 5-phosphate isomerase RpiB
LKNVNRQIIGDAITLEIVKGWKATDWLGDSEEKYARRVNKVKVIDASHYL